MAMKAQNINVNAFIKNLKAVAESWDKPGQRQYLAIKNGQLVASSDKPKAEELKQLKDLIDKSLMATKGVFDAQIDDNYTLRGKVNPDFDPYIAQNKEDREFLVKALEQNKENTIPSLFMAMFKSATYETEELRAVKETNDLLNYVINLSEYTQNAIKETR